MYRKLLMPLLIVALGLSVVGCAAKKPNTVHQSNNIVETTTNKETDESKEQHSNSSTTTEKEEEETSTEKETDILTESEPETEAAPENETTAPAEPETEPAPENRPEETTKAPAKPNTPSETTTQKATEGATKPAQTVKPTQPSTQAPTTAPKEESTTEAAKTIYEKKIDGVPYIVDTVKGVAYLKEFSCIGLTFPDEVHLQYEVDGYKVEYEMYSLVGIATKTLHIDKNISEILDIDLVEGVETYYWLNENLVDIAPYMFLDNTTIYLAAPSTQLLIAEGTGDWDENGNAIFVKRSLKELYDTQRDAWVNTKTFVCPDGTYHFNW